MCAGVRNAIDGGGEVGGGRVVDCLDPNRLRADPRAERVDEGLARGANTRRLGGAACKYHLGVGALRCVRGRHRRSLHRPRGRSRSTEQSSDAARPHGAILTHRDNKRAFITGDDWAVAEGFKTAEHITLQPRAGSVISRLASVTNTYSVHPNGDGSRLHMRVLLMMGKQSLAERDALTAV